MATLQMTDRKEGMEGGEKEREGERKKQGRKWGRDCAIYSHNKWYTVKQMNDSKLHATKRVTFACIFVIEVQVTWNNIS